MQCRCSKQGARVYSNSWGFPDASQDQPTWSSLQTAIRSVTSNGAFVAFAAGGSACLFHVCGIDSDSMCQYCTFLELGAGGSKQIIVSSSVNFCCRYSVGNDGMSIDPGQGDVTYPAAWSIPGMLTVIGMHECAFRCACLRAVTDGGASHTPQSRPTITQECNDMCSSCCKWSKRSLIFKLWKTVDSGPILCIHCHYCSVKPAFVAQRDVGSCQI